MSYPKKLNRRMDVAGWDENWMPIPIGFANPAWVHAVEERDKLINKQKGAIKRLKQSTKRLAKKLAAAKAKSI